MDIENATRTQALVVPLVEDWVSPEGEPVDEFLHVLEDSSSHDEVWPQPYDHLYVSLQSGRSLGNESDVGVDSERVDQIKSEPAVELEELEPLLSDEALAKDSHEPAAHLHDAVNEVQNMSTDADDLPKVDMDRPL